MWSPATFWSLWPSCHHWAQCKEAPHPGRLLPGSPGTGVQQSQQGRLEGPGPQLHPGSPHMPLPRKQPLIPHLAQPFQQQSRFTAVLRLATFSGTGQGHRWCWQVQDVTFLHFLISSKALINDFNYSLLIVYLQMIMGIYKRAHWHTHLLLIR